MPEQFVGMRTSVAEQERESQVASSRCGVTNRLCLRASPPDVGSVTTARACRCSGYTLTDGPQAEIGCPDMCCWQERSVAGCLLVLSHRPTPGLLDAGCAVDGTRGLCCLTFTWHSLPVLRSLAFVTTSGCDVFRRIRVKVNVQLETRSVSVDSASNEKVTCPA